MARSIVYLCALVWLGCMVAALLALNAPPQGDSFLRGFNRIEGFLTWQAVGAAVAVAAAVAFRFAAEPRSGVVRLLGIGPVAISALVIVALAALVTWAAFSPPPAEPVVAPPATTAPAPPA